MTAAWIGRGGWRGRVCRHVLGLYLLFAAGSCGPLQRAEPEPEHTAKRGAGRIIAMEQTARGGRLVFIAQNGERLTELTEIGPMPVRDRSPVWSPDGQWVAFVSSRGRDSLEESSLWVIRAEPGAAPRRLTFGTAVDLDPVWARDGNALIYSSDRSGASFDLWRLDLKIGNAGVPVATGEPVQLTDTLDQELHPSIGPDGQIVYMGVSPDGEISRLWLWNNGAVLPLTEGPADLTPTWSSDGSAIAFAALSSHAGEQGKAQEDVDLYLIGPDGRDRRLVMAEPMGEQTEPMWSPDGRFLFATSLYRSVESRRPVLSSITYVDLSESPRVMRALHDSVAVESRAGPTLDYSGNSAALDAEVLRQNQPYKDALRRAIEQELIRFLDNQDEQGAQGN